MADRLKKTREERFPHRSQSASPITVPDDSSNSTIRGRMANETRNRRRAEHSRAVTNDLCEIVSDMFVAESKLLHPSKYGVDSILQREQVYKSVQRFIDALPSRYALGVDTPSEVLLHMRLMSAARADNSRAAVHIMNMENGSHWPSPSSDSKGISRRLVTIACADTNGLLEYITKLLATGGSRVLDADVMLSSENIVLVSTWSIDHRQFAVALILTMCIVRIICYSGSICGRNAWKASIGQTCKLHRKLLGRSRQGAAAKLRSSVGYRL